jgi:hypothetical protein
MSGKISVLLILVLSLSQFSAAFNYQSRCRIGLRLGKGYTNLSRDNRIFAKYSEVEEEKFYDLLGTLVRAGPIPIIFRIFSKSKYEAAVQKFKMREKCSLQEAQANMDFYFRNANDWLAQRVRDEKRGIKTDYLNMSQDPASIALTLTWGTLASYLTVRIFLALVARLGDGV